MDAQALILVITFLAVSLLLGNGIMMRVANRHGHGAKWAADGVQEAEILVHAGYHPSNVRVRAGEPVRLIFHRAENNPCSSRVFFADPPLQRTLPPFADTAVQFIPSTPGNHLFTCEHGRYRGHLVVESAERRKWRHSPLHYVRATNVQ